MSDKLIKKSVINREELSEEYYFESLLQQANNKQVLAESELEAIQYECLNLLAYKVERYNAGDSSSIRVEKAQEILETVFFTIGIALKKYENPDDALAALHTLGVKEIYGKGLRRIHTLVAATKTIHAKLLVEIIKTPNVFYASTLEDAIKGFFKLYYPDYFATEIYITADYPLYNPRPRLLGIEFIKAYVQAAYFENKFCSYFNADIIHKLLCNYSKDYTELLINIYEFVLAAATGCVLLKKEVSKLNITPSGAQALQQAFDGRSEDKVFAVIYKAACWLNTKFSFSAGLWAYVQGSLKVLANKIVVLTKHHNLHQILLANEARATQNLFCTAERGGPRG